MARRFRFSVFSLALAASACAPAAELGDPRVVSHIGQPLVADIELTLLEDPATPVQVRAASTEVYRGAGIAVPPVLGSLNLSVTRQGGRQFLRVTSPRSVDADHVHLYLELVDKGQRAVRLATLWLTPDPNPAPAPAPAPGPVVVAPAPVPVVVAPRAPAPASTPAPDAVLLAQVERARAARAAAVVPPASSVSTVPTAETAAGMAAPVRPARAAAPRPHPAPAAKAPASAGKALALPAAHADAHPAACVRPAAEAQSCAALGAKNDELRARLGLVEDRMKKLQVTLGAAPGAPAQAQQMPRGAAESAPAPASKGGKAEAQPPAGEAATKAPAPAGEAATKAPAPAGEAAAKAPAPAAEAAPEAAPPQAPKPAEPVGPRPIHSIKPLVPHKPKAPPAPAPDAGLPWGWIGAAAAVLAAGGAGAFIVVRRRKAGAAAADAGPGAVAGAPDVPAAGLDAVDAPSSLLARLKARLAGRKRAPQPDTGAPAPAAEGAEPTFD